MQKKILVSGSLAYDHLFTYRGNFKDGISYNVEDKAVHFGGCAGNIAYTLKLLGEDPLVFGIAGKDFSEYEKWLKKNKINTSYVLHEPSTYTSQATVLTDAQNQQLTFFYEGAATHSLKYTQILKKKIKKYAPQCAVAIISPNNRDFIIATLMACYQNKVPYIFDPGQAIALFTKRELISFIRKSAGLMVNEYEASLLEKKIGFSHNAWGKFTNLIVINKTKKGSLIIFRNQKIHIPAIAVKNPRDPTGCGDAYRAGFLTIIKNNLSHLTPELLKKAGQLGTQCAAVCLQCMGTQNHQLRPPLKAASNKSTSKSWLGRPLKSYDKT